jgi:hypothetical protein
LTNEATASTPDRSGQFSERQIELNGWPVRLTSYRVGEKYVCQADNVSPGACLARFSAATPEEAEAQAISKARHLLGKTKRRDV